MCFPDFSNTVPRGSRFPSQNLSNQLAILPLEQQAFAMVIKWFMRAPENLYRWSDAEERPRSSSLCSCRARALLPPL
jgi:hypothetical protein